MRCRNRTLMYVPLMEYLRVKYKRYSVLSKSKTIVSGRIRIKRGTMLDVGQLIWKRPPSGRSTFNLDVAASRIPY